ncbi:hypothetical protein AB0B09_12560, partial [Streptomyces sp. NPDC044948]
MVAFWDFSGTFSFTNRHERETTERPFPQVSDRIPRIAAGHGADWSLPGHLRGTLLAGITPRRADVPIHSTVTGGTLDGTEMTAS